MDIDCPQDIERAKALLAEAGHAGGVDIEIKVSTLEPSWPAMAEAYQAQAAEAGIRVKISQVSTGGYWSDVWMKETVSMARWNERPAAV